MTDNLSFKPNTEAGKILIKWWEELELSTGDRAKLRSSSELMEIFFVPAYHRLLNSLSKSYPQEKGLEKRIAIIAALAATVKNAGSGGTSSSLPEQMAKAPSKTDKSPVSQLRFRKLLECQDREELFPLLRRVIKMLGQTVDIYRLADDVYWWGDRRKRDWAHEYYSVAPKN